MIGDLGYFVKVDSVVLEAQDPAYLFLFSKSADPDYTTVEDAYKIKTVALDLMKKIQNEIQTLRIVSKIPYRGCMYRRGADLRPVPRKSKCDLCKYIRAELQRIA